MAVAFGKAADLADAPAKRIVAEQPFLALKRRDTHQPVMHIPAIAPALGPKAVTLDPPLDQAAAIVMGELDLFAFGSSCDLHHAAGAALPAVWLGRRHG